MNKITDLEFKNPVISCPVSDDMTDLLREGCEKDAQGSGGSGWYETGYLLERTIQKGPFPIWNAKLGEVGKHA